MKLTYTKLLSRKILLAFLSFVIILTVAALFVRNSISNKLARIATLAHNVQFDQSKPQHALLLVHQAENEFQESLLNTHTGNSNDYKTKLSEALNEINLLLKEQPDTVGLTTAQYKKIHYWYNKKLNLSNRLYILKHDFDSLLAVYSGYNSAVTNLPVINTTIHTGNINVIANSDTIKKSAGGKKMGFLARIKNAIANKNTSPSVNVIEINHNRTNKLIDSATRKIISNNKNAYAQSLRQLQQRNIKLLTTQKELVNFNIYISNELENIINEEKEISYSLKNELNEMAFKSYRDTTALLNDLYLATLFLVLVFALLLILFIVKLDKAEVLLLEENKRAVAIAQQKMDLLLHMSHEIRNPLTAIQGFLYIFSQTVLTTRQTEMLGSIRLSSEMLLRTLNDVLDAAKMENSEFKINNDPFNPDFVLKEVIESMEFSALKKKLNLAYHFEGDKDIILLGDSFRLKQLMVNLLSNAIKYTKIGGINVAAKLELIKGENTLKVDITDTGEGISLEQQANLFSKYYQTNSAKGKIGTGLGLYICKELINLQKGQITVKSEAGKGSTFSFCIPYKEDIINQNNTSKQLTDDPLSLFNGLRILAVDDNELNLMFLKMMTGKWNIKFYGAANGNEALDILCKENISVVLTDLQMPEMSGDELLAKIKQLNAPFNKVPVIVITGDATNETLLLNNGFSGFIAKPFIDSELIKQIAGALKL